MLEDARELAVAAVRVGMEVVRGWDNGLGVRRVSAAGGMYDAYQTAVDDAAGAAIRRVLDASGIDGDWAVDAVDGTTNLVLGDSFVGVTLALLVDGQPVVGATGRPSTDEVWSAARDCGAYDGSGRRLEIGDRPPGEWRIVLDPAKSGPRYRERWQLVHDRLIEVFGTVEVRSAISLELAYVAAGKVDGLVQIGGSPLEDFAAGVLLVREAGGVVEGLSGSPEVWREDAVFAGSSAVCREVRQSLEPLLE